MKKFILFLLFISNFSFSQMIREKVFYSEPITNNNVLRIYLDAEKYINNKNQVYVRPMTKVEYSLIDYSYETFVTTLSFNLSPISANGNIEVKYSPFFFIEIPLGIIAGTGWFNEPFGNGIGIYSNFYEENNKENVYTKESFTKVYLKYYISTKFIFNFDFITTYFNQTLYYRYFLGTKKDSDVWLYENVPDNLKYFRYNYEFFIGFNLPLLLNRIGIFFKSDYDIQHFGESKVNDGGWGSDIPVTRFGLDFTAGRKLILDFILTWGNEPNYLENYGNNLILKERKIRQDVPEYWFLREVSLILSYKF